MEFKLNAYLETLKLYVPIVDRVHGKAHPEFNEVHRLFDEFMEKKDGGNLDEVFARLREVTSNYRVPEDTCESYEAVYMMLAELEDYYGAGR